MNVDKSDDRSERDRAARASLDQLVTGNAEALRRLNRHKSGWCLNLYPEAGEASGSFRASHKPLSSSPFIINPEERTPTEAISARQHSQEESARRAKRQIRRYCAHNGLNRLVTLTFEGEGCHDQYQLRLLLGEFFKKLHKKIGRDFAYCWVPECHPQGHGLHAHVAVGRFIKRSLLEAAWPHGFVHIKLIGDLPHGSQTLHQARATAGYLSKYVAKQFADDRHIDGMHRYDVAQGFRPKPTKLFAPKLSEVLGVAVERMGAPFDYIWHSNKDPTWDRPAAVYLSW